MSTATYNSLVLYKSRPARVLSVADKLEIEVADRGTQRVRPKDVVLLHPGPLERLSDLTPRAGELEAAWEILAGDSTELAELAELVYGHYTPATAWAAWGLVADGLYFHGTPDRIQARTAEDLESVRATREARETEQRAWSGFVQRLEAGRVLPEDDRYLSDVEALALARANRSRVMRDLGRDETSEAAHGLLLRVGRWGEGVNPYPRRLGMPSGEPEVELPQMPEEERLDLTHLPAYAIDDDDNQDPDDALSLDGDRLWIHVADVAGMVAPDSPADREARARGANLYLPETTVPMLPSAVTQRLGLGLHEVSPALSIGLSAAEDGTLYDVRIVLSRVRVTRLSYGQADTRLGDEPLAGVLRMTERFRARRRAAGAAFIELPEVRVRVDGGDVTIRPIPRLRSREMVTDAMLMAGEAVARRALELGIALPFATQPAPETGDEAKGMAAMHAMRKRFQRTQMKTVAEPHAGLGLEVYAQATSPLRRYLDLVVHQQLRAWLCNRTPLTREEILLRVGAAEAVIGKLRKTERLSNRHWTLVHLLRSPGWRGGAVVVERRGRRSTVIIPELALDATVQLRGDPALDDRVRVELSGIDLPALAAYFKS